MLVLITTLANLTFLNKENKVGKNISCLNSLVRITIDGNNAILSNLSNGKWIKLKKNNLDLFNACNANEVMQNCLSIGLQHDEAKEFIDVLIQNDFFVSKNSQDTERGRLIFKLQAAYLHVTNFCNLTCRHCYRGSHPQSEHGLDINAMFTIIDRLRKADIRFLVIAGGEPLARPDIGDLLKYIGISGFDNVTLLTNGTLVTDKLARLIADYADNVHVSLDGPNEEINAQIRGKGAFERTINGIRKLKSAGVKKIKIITSITSANISRLHEMSQIQKELGVDFGTSIFAEVGRGTEYSYLKPKISDIISYFRNKTVSLDCNPMASDPNLLDINAGVTCGSGTLMFSVDCFGNIFPCHLLHMPELKIGNILNQGNLLEIIRESPVARQMQERVVENKKCHGCSVEYFCKGGCLAHTISANRYSENPWLEKDPFCKVHKEILGLQIWEDE